jgi:SAM-dependent methyltransferase
MNKTPEEWHNRFIQQTHWTVDLRRHLYRRAGLGHDHQILEVGCGTGALLIELAARGKQMIHGLDIKLDYLTLADVYVPASRLVQGDAHNTPYASGSFDLVICHFLLMWVHDPEVVVTEMARLVRPGGSVMALAEPDYGGRIDYPESLSELGRQQEGALLRQGAATRLGRRLGAIFQRAGLAEIETGVLGGQWRQPPSTEEQELEWSVLAADLEDHVSEEELAHYRAIDAQAWKRGERTLFVPTFYAWGKKL